jgi:hypothetical protein
MTYLVTLQDFSIPRTPCQLHVSPNFEAAPSSFVSTNSSTRRALLTLVYHTRLDCRAIRFRPTAPGELWTPINSLAPLPLGAWGAAAWLGFNQSSTQFSTFSMIFRAYPFTSPILNRPSEIIFPGYPAPWNFTQPTNHLAMPTEALTLLVTPEAGPSISLGKRRYETTVMLFRHLTTRTATTTNPAA